MLTFHFQLDFPVNGSECIAFAAVGALRWKLWGLTKVINLKTQRGFMVDCELLLLSHPTLCRTLKYAPNAEDVSGISRMAPEILYDLSGFVWKGTHVTPGHCLTDQWSKKTLVAQSSIEGSGSDCELRVLLKTQRERAPKMRSKNDQIYMLLLSIDQNLPTYCRCVRRCCFPSQPPSCPMTLYILFYEPWSWI